MFYLYLKTHQHTGLKYLGFTKNNPYKYQGSGKYWLSHLKKHGNHITTEILLQTEDKSLIKEQGKYFSVLWNIVESKEFANLSLEEGTGGSTFAGRKHSQESIQKMSAAKKGKVFSDSHRLKLSTSHAGTRIGENNHMFGKHHTDETKAKLSESLKGKVRSEEFKQNLSKLYKGVKRKPLSEETKRKISESKRRKNVVDH